MQHRSDKEILMMMRLLFSWRDRISRAGWWLGNFMSVLVAGLLFLFDIIRFSSNGYDSLVIYIQEEPFAVSIFIYIQVCLAIKRYHDIGMSGYYSLLLLIPVIGWLIIIVSCGFMKGDPNKNRYGVRTI